MENAKFDCGRKNYCFQNFSNHTPFPSHSYFDGNYQRSKQKEFIWKTTQKLSTPLYVTNMKIAA